MGERRVSVREGGRERERERERDGVPPSHHEMSIKRQQLRMRKEGEHGDREREEHEPRE